MNWQKITWISLITIVLLFGLSYLLSHYAQDFCSVGHYSCFEILKDSFAFPLLNLLPYVLVVLIFVLFLSKKYKKIIYLFTFFITIFLFIFIFNLPVSCSNIVCGDRVTGSLLFRYLYPVILIPTVLIMWIYFRIKDYKEKINQLK